MKDDFRKHITEILHERAFHNIPVEISDRSKTDDEYNHQLYSKWEQAERFVKLLEMIRDANTPKTPDEDWNQNFCTAIEMLPEARRTAEDYWWNYYTYKGEKQ